MLLEASLFTGIQKEVICDIKVALGQTDDVLELSELLSRIYGDVSEKRSWLSEFSVSLDRTIHHMDDWDYCKGFHSVDAIVINQGFGEARVIWREGDEWSLSDRYTGHLVIAKQLSKWPSLEMPEDVREILYLLGKESWSFSLLLPYLSQKIPTDLDEIVSWDDDYLITGTTLENISLVSRDEWEEIKKRERWYENL